MVIGLALLFGIMAVIPIGGADMPVVISLLNSYSGLAACGRLCDQQQRVDRGGSLVGASGIILTQIMCKAMNRSLLMCCSQASPASLTRRPWSRASRFRWKTPGAEAATNVAIIPGYGMAVAQAQHVVKELTELLENNAARSTLASTPLRAGCRVT